MGVIEDFALLESQVQQVEACQAKVADLSSQLTAAQDELKSAETDAKGTEERLTKLIGALLPSAKAKDPRVRVSS